MTRLLAPVFCLLLLASGAFADAVFAAVRLPSHGASGTVIHTEQGKSYILSCAHAFEGASKSKPIVIDIPAVQPGPPKTVAIKLIKLDYQSDLALIEFGDGPLPNIALVAPVGHRLSGQFLSAGYDSMKWPMTKASARMIRDDGSYIWTYEKPWHGRSGGPLLDGDYLIGVCHGYTTGPSGAGMYVSMQRVHLFLGWAGGAGGSRAPPRSAPIGALPSSPYPSYPPLNCPPGGGGS